MNLGCIVLAAGQGRRFGANKLLHPLAGKPVLAHVLDHLPRENFRNMAAVVSSEGARRLCEERKIPCLFYKGGPQSESIRLGLSAMEDMDGCMFVMGDQPLCSKTSMQRIVDAFLLHPDAVIRLAWHGTPCSPVLFPRKYFPHLMKLEGERGGMSAIRSMNPEIVLVEAAREEELLDVDTQRDLIRLENGFFERKEGSDRFPE